MADDKISQLPTGTIDNLYAVLPLSIGMTGTPQTIKSEIAQFVEFIGVSNGWLPTHEAWTRTGNHTFTVPGNLTAKYRKGAKVRYKDGSSFEYGVIYSSSHAAGTTTVTLITNTDYTMAAATITDRYISYSDRPEGFPTEFNYAATITAQSGSFTSTTMHRAIWRVIGGVMSVAIDVELVNVGTASGIIFISTPVTVVNNSVCGSGREDNVVADMLQFVQASTTAISITDYAGAGVIVNNYRHKCTIHGISF